MPKKPLNYIPVGNANVLVDIDKYLVAGFCETFLQDDFDAPKPSPEFHYALWQLFCCDHPQVAVAAPRGHAKSTAGTLAFGLASLLFGSDDFLLLVSATERLAAGHLANMARVLTDNEDLKTEFNVEVLQSNETELTARCGDREFHVLGKGAEQKVRGALWRNKRPSLIIVDDLEEDEAVMSKERREKLRVWFFNALLPVGSDNLRVRFLGTILHVDSLLQNILTDDQWVGEKFAAHKGFDDFSEILWPEKFPEVRLRFIRQTYLNQGNPSGYSQEYLSKPVAEADAYFRKADFRPMVDTDHTSPKTMYASIEFALGQSSKGDNTAIVIGGMDEHGMLHIIEVLADRYDPLQAVNLMFDIQERYDILEWVVEDENIAKAIGPFLNQEMVKRNQFMNLRKIRPSKEKQQRATSIKARMRAGGVKFDFDAPWFDAFRGELLDFPRGKTDDRVDALAWLGLMLDQLIPSLTRKQLDELAWEAEMDEGKAAMDGRSRVTGY